MKKTDATKHKNFGNNQGGLLAGAKEKILAQNMYIDTKMISLSSSREEILFVKMDFLLRIQL